jgi:hypothetical protein
VRVRKGVKDPDYPDIPLGGWTGTVIETHESREDGRTYLVEWDETALNQMHPVYRRRCQRDGLDLDSAWLDEGDLEINTGEPVGIEQPGTLTPRPLDLGEQEDRVRAVFDLTSDDPLPAPNHERLEHYHRFLSERLRFPLEAQYADMNGCVPGAEETVKFVGLAPLDQMRVKNGLLAEIERANGQREAVELFDVETPRNEYARQLLGDYSYWFCEAFRYDLAEKGRQELRAEGAAGPARWPIGSLLVRCGVYGALCGAVVGAITAAMEWAPLGLAVAAGVFAVIGYFLGSWLGLLLRALRLGQSAPRLGSLFGALAGAVVGAVVGPLLVAFAGTVLGSVAGFIIFHTLAKLGIKRPGGFLGGLVGAGAGGVVLACLTDMDRATIGLLCGAVLGAVLGVVLMLLVLVSLAMVEVRQDKHRE